MFASSAASDKAQEVARNGGTAEQIFLSAAAAAIAEAFFEKFSIEQLQAFKQMPANDVKNFVLNIVKGSVTEGSEELGTEIVNAITDKLINGDNSSFDREYQSYIDSGMTPEEAKEM